MARKRQARKCSGRRTDGQACGNYAVNGATVCGTHGGRAPQVKAKARENLAEERLEKLLYRYQAEPCASPLEALQRLAGRALALEQAIGTMVNDLTSIRYQNDHGEQLRAEVAVLERAMDRAGRLLVDIAKLNIEERMARVTELQVQQVTAALTTAFAEMGLSRQQQRDARQRVARHLRPVA